MVRRCSFSPSARSETILRSRTFATACFGALFFFTARPVVSAEVTGRVVSFPDGGPLTGVTVLAIDRSGAAAAGVTDGGGDFRVVGVDPGWVRVQARPPDEMNRIGAYFGDVRSFCLAPEVHTDSAPQDLVVELPTGGIVAGRITDHLGDPVPNALVQALGLDAFNRGQLRRAVTGDDGRYEVTGLDSVVIESAPVPGAYRLSVRVDGAAAWYGAGWTRDAAEPVLATRGATTSWNSVLPAPVALSGRVEDASGGPVPGAMVTVEPRGGAGRSALTDTDGSFLVSGLRGEAADVRVQAAGFATTVAAEDVVLIDDPALPAPVRLSREAVLLVTVSEGAAGRVEVRSEAGALLGAAPAASEVRLGGLPSGFLQVAFVPDGTDDRMPVSVDAVEAVVAETRTVALEPPRGGWVAGRIERREGSPLRNATAEFEAVDGSMSTSTTDGDGGFLVGPVPAGKGTLVARWEPFCSGDPGRAPRVPPDARGGDDPEADGVVVRVGEVSEVAPLRLPPDRDRDAMDDLWELLWGPNPDRADATVDLDGDGATNLEEYLARTDPLDGSDAPGCSLGWSGVPAHSGSTIVLAALASGAVRRRRRSALVPLC